MVDRLVDAGCIWLNGLALLPPSITDVEPRPDDDRFRFVTGRRPIVEAVFANAAGEAKGISVRRGVGVEELVTGSSAIDGVPHVAGVRTSEGDVLHADLVVDAMGRRSPLVEWLTASACAHHSSNPRTTGSSTTRATSPVRSSPR